MCSADISDMGLRELGDQAFAPKMLIDYILSDSISSNLSLLQAAIHFNQGDPNEKSKIRFLLLLKYVGQKNPRVLSKIYFKIRPTLRQIISENSSSVALITAVFDVASIASTQPDYNQDTKFNAYADQLLIENEITGLNKYRFPKSDNRGSETTDPNGLKRSRGHFIQPFVQRICATRVETE